MEYTRYLLPLTYPSEQLELEDPTTLLRARQPLSDLAGNAQPDALASTGLHYEYKGSQPGSEGSLCSIPTLPSQPQRNDIGSALELRRQGTRKRRQLKFGRNTILNSPQYRAYRERQKREGGNDKDSKWPDVLEEAFLDALIELPQMERLKYEYGGKLHGRNELITQYLWIAYQQSLAPGAPLDEEMRRTRKQVSSHIQVLKGLLRHHPALHLLFPEQPKPAKNGFQDSLKDDPCLKALSEGRLPGKRAYTQHQPQIKPALFWLVLKADEDNRGIDLYGGEGVLHQFSKLSLHPRNRISLESIRYWRDRFPLLHQLQAREALNSPIIHMDVSLNLLSSPPSQSSQLRSRTMLSIPGGNKCEWQIVTTLEKPPELCSDAMHDGHLKGPPTNQAAFAAQVSSRSESETLIKVSFPAAQFAYVFACLVGIQQQYEGEMKAQSFGRGSDPTIRPAREYVERVSMFQELQSQAAPGVPFVTQAIFIWTFHEAREGESNHTTWGYLDPAPPRRTVMSPSPHPMHQVNAIMNENYHNWAEAPLLMQHTNVLDSYGQGVGTPAQTAGLESPFGSDAHSFSQQPYDMQSENLSFISSNTLDSDSTLVDDTVTNIESFLSNAQANLAEYEQHASNWQLPVSDSFDADPAWANYAVPASTPVVAWDAEARAHVWPETELPETRQIDWVEETSPKHHGHDEWSANSPTKHVNYVEQNIEQKLMPWIHDRRGSNGDITHEFEPVLEPRIVEVVEMDMEIALRGNGELDIQHEAMGDHGMDIHTLDDHNMVSHAKDTEWHTDPNDGFDYAKLAERLKA